MSKLVFKLKSVPKEEADGVRSVLRDCGIDFYEGDEFPNWKYNLFATSLARQEFHRLIIKDGEVVEDEILFRQEGRMRDVASGPDGYIYVVFNGPGRIVRLIPR